MKIREIKELLDAEVVCGEDALETDVHSACGSDMMSDVLAYVKDQAVLLTGLVNSQVIRTGGKSLDAVMNGGSMLELVRYQKTELPKAAGAEELELSAYDILKAETAGRSEYTREIGKYTDLINHELSLQGKKKAQFMIHKYI